MPNFLGFLSFFLLQNQHVCQTSSHILQEEIHKLSLPSGIPQALGELKNILQATFAIEQDFNI